MASTISSITSKHLKDGTYNLNLKINKYSN